MYIRYEESAGSLYTVQTLVLEWARRVYYRRFKKVLHKPQENVLNDVANTVILAIDR
jgi:hypothetical protein